VKSTHVATYQSDAASETITRWRRDPVRLGAILTWQTGNRLGDVSLTLLQYGDVYQAARARLVRELTEETKQ
jgi:hypothetical protein